jgi:hypothetical protein
MECKTRLPLAGPGVAVAVAATLAIAVMLSAIGRRMVAPCAPEDPTPVSIWRQRRDELEAWLAAHPQDHKARVRLADCLIQLATNQSWQRCSNPGSTALEVPPGEERRCFEAAFAGSREAAAAGAAARMAARLAPDAAVQARAWELLAVLHSRQGEGPEYTASLEAAAHVRKGESPCSASH